MAGRRGRGENSLFKRADGLWCARIELPSQGGKRRYKQVASKSKPAALRKLKDLEAQLARHGDILTDTMTLTDYLTYWLDSVAATRVKPSTLATYRGQMLGHVAPRIGDTKLHKVTATHILALHRLMRDDKVASTTILNTHSVLTKALTDAKREGRISENPCDNVDRPVAKTGDLEALTAEEAVQLLEWVQAHESEREAAGEPYAGLTALVATYLLTGQRRGEVLGLELDRVADGLDISWQLQYIKDITQAPADFEYRPVVGTLYLTRPKSKKGWRVIPLVDPLKSILEAHIEKMPPNQYGLLFTKPDGSPWFPAHWGETWRTIYKGAGINKRIRLHDLRHTAVDLLLLAGVPEDMIAEIVGHSNIAMTRAYKSRGNKVRLTAAMESLSTLLQLDK